MAKVRTYAQAVSETNTREVVESIKQIIINSDLSQDEAITATAHLLGTLIRCMGPNDTSRKLKLEEVFRAVIIMKAQALRDPPSITNATGKDKEPS